MYQQNRYDSPPRGTMRMQPFRIPDDAASSSEDGGMHAACHGMNAWQDRLMQLSRESTCCKQSFIYCLSEAASALGFEYVAYLFQGRLSLTEPTTVAFNNFPHAWQEKYQSRNYLQVDPAMILARQCTQPLIWSDSLYEAQPALRREAIAHGLCHGCSFHISDNILGASTLSLARTGPALDQDEVHAKQHMIQWVTQTAHLGCHRLLQNHLAAGILPLTEREQEVLRWTGAGKSAQDIARILSLSKSTVDFHIRNSVNKLNAPNKTAAVVRALLLGLLG